ncbi:MAG: cellulase family glycosylhydrolase [Myxococcales bacterium]
MFGRSWLLVSWFGLMACGPGTIISGSDLDPVMAGDGDSETLDDAGNRPISSDSGPGKPLLGDDAGPGDRAGHDAETTASRLVVQGNRILLDGAPFHGRGANLNDVRSCGACSFAPPDPAGIDRWADELIDGWHANFIRFVLSSKSAPYNQYELQWNNLVDDPAYLAAIVQNVRHMTQKPGVYVLVTLFMDPTMKPNNGDYDSEWPFSMGDTNTRYAALAEAFHDDPKVLFGLTNEPHTSPEHAAELASAYARAITTIRAVEDKHGVPHHVVVVQAPGGWARDLDYFVAHPLAGDQIAYEVHPYNRASDLDALLAKPSATLPLVIGEYGLTDLMDESDIRALWQLAQEHEIPHIAWAFHHNCPPSLLQNTAPDGCGLSASSGYDFPRTEWGDLLYEHLKTTW